MANNELQHWGIKGQKWGVRRYQNKDGSLTPAGRDRYDDSGDSGYDLYYKERRKVEKKAERKARNKRLLKIGLMAATTAIVVVGTQKYKESKDSKAARQGEEALKEIFSDVYGKQPKKKKIKKVTSIAHSGIKGMRWGVRRYQNKDGSLTPAGRKRYADKISETDRITTEERRRMAEESDKRFREENKKFAMNSGKAWIVKKASSEMTNEELRKALERVELIERLNGKASFVNGIDNARVNAEKLLNAYNTAAKINNTFNKRFKLTEVDARTKEMVDQYANKLVNSSTAKEVAANLDKLTAAQIQTAKTRFENEKSIRAAAAEPAKAAKRQAEDAAKAKAKSEKDHIDYLMKQAPADEVFKNMSKLNAAQINAVRDRLEKYSQEESKVEEAKKAIEKLAKNKK